MEKESRVEPNLEPQRIPIESLLNPNTKKTDAWWKALLSDVFLYFFLCTWKRVKINKIRSNDSLPSKDEKDK